MTYRKTDSYKWLALLTVSISTFIGTLDASIVNISFPRLVVVFETEPSIVLWVSASFLLTSTGLMLSIGRVADAVGTKKIYLLGSVLFVVGLTLCALSQNIIQLIVCRMVQGLGAAMTIALSNAIVTSAFPQEERGRAMGILGAVVSIGLLSGPVLGGFLLDTLDWRAIFWVRVPVAIIGTVMAWILLKEHKRSDYQFRFDLRGTLTLFGTLCFLLLFFNIGGRSGFTSLPVLLLAAGTMASFVLFIVSEIRAPQPVVDLSLFRNRIFTTDNISLGIIFVAQAGVVFLMPFYLIDGLDYSASEAGMLMAVVSVTTLVVSPLSGWLSDSTGSRPLCVAGVAVVTLALFLLSRLDIDSTRVDILLCLVCLGIGTGLFQPPNISSIMGSVARDKIGTASAMIGTVRQTGMSIGIAIAGSIFTARQLLYYSQLSQSKITPLMLQKLSLIGGFGDTLIVGAIICSIGILTLLYRGKSRPS